jgi:acyl-CoA thioester hydrolase
MQAGRGGKNTRTIPEHCVSQTLQRIGVAETDMMGIVHHAHYVVYLEVGRLEYMRRRGFSYKQLVERGYHMPVVELGIRYRKPAFFDDLLCVSTRLGGLTRVTARFDYSVTRSAVTAGAESPTLELLLEAHVLLACVDAKKRPRQLPEDIVSALFLAEAAGAEAAGAEADGADADADAERVTPGSRAGRAGSA